MPLKSYTLLLVEDNADDEFLSLKGIADSNVPCEVSVVRDGGEILPMLLSPEVPKPDLIVLDFHLPGRNGLEILRELRRHEKTKSVPIVMLSALGSDRELKQCLEEGANSFIHKPDDALIYVRDVALTVRYWLTVHRRWEDERSFLNNFGAHRLESTESSPGNP